MSGKRWSAWESESTSKPTYRKHEAKSVSKEGWSLWERKEIKAKVILLHAFLELPSYFLEKVNTLPSLML